MTSNRSLAPWAVGAALALLLMATPDAALAGCGCDHPPPAWAMVMPPFGSPGRAVSVFADTGSFVVGEKYRVRIANRALEVVAEDETVLEVVVPEDANPGPTEIRVDGPEYTQTYSADLFTVMPPARVVPEQPGLFLARDFRVAISESGTLLMPMDVSAVLDPTQLAFALLDFPLAFAHDDVVIYNADGVDLTLFTLQVKDPTRRQWGKYYGWNVQQDAGLTGVVYDHFVETSLRVDRMSDLFSYWRHEFHTYAQAHAAGGSHAIDAKGLHPDGTRHIDHDHLVIAISGRLRNRQDPQLTTPLRPGMQNVNLGWVSVQTPGPMDPASLMPLLDTAAQGQSGAVGTLSE